MKRLSHEEFLLKFNEVSNGEYELLSKYINRRTQVDIKHIACGHEFPMNPDNFIRGQGCPKCRYKKSTKSRIESTADGVIAKLKIKLGSEYEIIGEYKGYLEYIKIRHSTCGNEYDTTPANVINQNTKCPKCAIKEVGKKRRKSPEQYKEEFKEKANDEYELLSEYVDNRTKVLVKHVKCSCEFEVRPLIFLGGSGCPQCNESRGEREVRRFLDKYSLKYIAQYKIPECRNKHVLPFDFAVLDNNDNLIALIEYQGIQHYKKTGYFNSQEKLKYTQHNDNIKKEFCNKNNIKLVEIPYWDFDNIEKIIKNI